MRKIFLLFALFCFLPAFGQVNSLPHPTEIYSIPEIGRFQEFLTGNTSDAPYYIFNRTSTRTETKQGHLYRIKGRDGEIEINTCGSDYDTYLYVFEAVGNAWECIVYRDDDNSSCPDLSGLMSRVTFNAERGKDYLVFVSGYRANKGYYELNILRQDDDLRDKPIFTYYSIPGQTGESEIDPVNNIIDVFFPMESDLSGKAASFEYRNVDEPLSVKIDGQIQQSGVTQNDFSGYVQYELSSEDGSFIDFWLVRVHELLPDGTRPVYELGFNSFNLQGQVGETLIDWDNKTVEVEVHSDVNISDLVASFSVGTNERRAAEDYWVRVQDTPQISGHTTNDYSNYLSYEISTHDGTVSSFWTVKVTKQFPSGEIGGDNASFTIPDQVGDARYIDDEVIIKMPYGTNLENLRPEFNLAYGATVYVDGEEQTSGQSVQNFSQPVRYEVVSENGLNQVFFDVAVELLPGSSEVELNNFYFYYSFDYNRYSTSGSVDNENREIHLRVPYSASLSISDFYYYNIRTTCNLAASYDGEFHSSYTFNGWREYYIKLDLETDNTLTFLAEDGTEVTYRVIVEREQLSDDTSFRYIYLGGNWDYRGYENETSKEITFRVPFGTDVSQMQGTIFGRNNLAWFYINDIRVGTAFTNFTADFSNPVTLTVEAEDGATLDFWQLKVEFEEPSSAADFTSFHLTDSEGAFVGDSYIIDEGENEIRVTVPYDYVYGGEEIKDLTDLTAHFSLSQGASAYIGSQQQISGEGSQNFTGGMMYFLEAQDGITTEVWNVSISIEEPERDARIDVVSIDGGQIPVSIDQERNDILVYAPQGTDVSALKADFGVSPKARLYSDNEHLISKEKSLDLNRVNILKVVSQDKNTEQEYTIRRAPGIVTTIAKEEEDLFKVFPNPASEVIYIILPGGMDDEVVVRVFDLEGNRVIEEKCNALHNESWPLDVSDLDSGVYFLSLQVVDDVKTQKIVIE